MLSEKIKKVARKIGQFYLEKNNRDLKATEIEINNLGISNLKLHENTVEITTKKPGLLIGKNGINIDNLTEFLNMHVYIIEEADPLDHYLIPQNWEERLC